MALLHFVIPFGILIIFTVALRKPLYIAAGISYLASVLLFAILGEPVSILMRGLTMAFFVALEISLVLTGAVFFLNFLKAHKVIDEIHEGLQSITSDKILQVILLAWLFGSFIEGSAGFGTPALIIAPLLAALGLPLQIAVAIPLLADTTAVVFGAIGTPVKIGFGALDVQNIAPVTAFINLCTGFIVPVMLVWVLKKYYPPMKDINLKTYFPFAVFAGFAFTFPSWVLSYLGPEFPSLLGGLIGLFLVIFAIKYKFLLPVTESKDAGNKISTSKFAKSFIPYIGLSILLIAGRMIFTDIYMDLPLWDDLTRRLYLFQPGMAFITMPFIMILLFRNKYQFRNFAPSFSKALQAVPKPALAILFIAGIAQNLVMSKQSFLSPIMPHLPEPLAVFITPFFGALGSFAAGSATVSALLFGQEINSVANAMDIDNLLALSLLLVGAGIGNAVALQNIAVVQAAIGGQGQERDFLKVLVWPCIFYLLLVGIFGVIYSIL
jgi:lactate permease